jgi:hypothetical protein
MNMNKYERLNQQKKYRSEKFFSGKKRVAAYCRVSTEKEEQAQSFESQCDFFRCYIEQKKEWEFYKVFADEGISGTSTKKREQFNQMIAEAKQRKFDLLITKEISRFARNTLDSIYYTRELRKVGVGVLFLNDGINTLDGDAELRLSIMASIAFNSRVTFPQVYTEGITKISADDIRYAKEFGYVIKLLGLARNTPEGIEVKVHPMLIDENHPLAGVKDAFNAVFVHADAMDDAMFMGRGAGQMQ